MHASRSDWQGGPSWCRSPAAAVCLSMSVRCPPRRGSGTFPPSPGGRRTWRPCSPRGRRISRSRWPSGLARARSKATCATSASNSAFTRARRQPPGPGSGQVRGRLHRARHGTRRRGGHRAQAACCARPIQQWQSPPVLASFLCPLLREFGRKSTGRSPRWSTRYANGGSGTTRATSQATIASRLLRRRSALHLACRLRSINLYSQLLSGACFG
jgi:hypothetical protein